ncbi:hypothetical protein ACI2IY_09100 [Lysobacter enzymogenes]|uniref:hypothetical protein n=1 Tax=Lysobacter enzymogenes TaxID=69 RepID=UPI00384BEFB8
MLTSSPPATPTDDRAHGARNVATVDAASPAPGLLESLPPRPGAPTYLPPRRAGAATATRLAFLAAAVALGVSAWRRFGRS